ncbi:MAG: hypothetical protein IJ512_06790 [Ruminococcus sp.]|nr:hypothetical protein [Ruminococcus sp.]
MKTKSRKKLKYSLLFVLSLFLIIMVILMLNPLRHSKEGIRARLLKQTPVGTDMDDVIQYLENQEDWEIRYVNHTSGYNYFHGEPYEANVGTEIGEKSIRVYLGEYRNPLAVDVSAFYAFNADGKLIDAAIMKTIDGI